jgi:hypothetical protein
MWCICSVPEIITPLLRDFTRICHCLPAMPRCRVMRRACLTMSRSGYAKPDNLEALTTISPLTLKLRLLQHLKDEMSHGRAGRPAAVWAKLNSVIEPDIYYRCAVRPDRASQAGVKIDLVVRAGICGVWPGLGSKVCPTIIYGSNPSLVGFWIIRGSLVLVSSILNLSRAFPAVQYLLSPTWWTILVPILSVRRTYGQVSRIQSWICLQRVPEDYFLKMLSPVLSTTKKKIQRDCETISKQFKCRHDTTS